MHDEPMTEPSPTQTGQAAGVPFVLRPVKVARSDTPLVIIWHLGDPPCSARAMAAAIRLESVDAHRVYLALPQLGERLGPGGWDAVVALAMKDPVLGFFQPIQAQAAR